MCIPHWEDIIKVISKWRGERLVLFIMYFYTSLCCLIFSPRSMLWIWMCMEYSAGLKLKCFWVFPFSFLVMEEPSVIVLCCVWVSGSYTDVWWGHSLVLGPLVLSRKGKFVNWNAPLSWLSVTTELTKSLIHVSFYAARFPSFSLFWAELTRSIQDSNPQNQYLMIVTWYPSPSLESLLTLILVRILLAIWLFLYFTLLWKEHNMRFTHLTKF